VTATVGGRTVQAKLARWSVDRTVAFFWFAERDVPDGSTAAGLTAFDAQGKRLPAGNTDVGVG
jgi:hypothetical protein